VGALRCEEAGPTETSLGRENSVIGLDICKIMNRINSPTFIASAPGWDLMLLRIAAGLTVALLLLSGMAVSQTEAEEPGAVFELGAAGEHSLKGGGSNYGATIAIEVTPIENWLELEGGVTSLFNHGKTEWDTGLLFKKPWTLSDRVEFMIGLGPQWIHTTGQGSSSNSVGGEAVLDFMFWPSSKHKFGWYLEPSYGYDFGKGHEQSLGVSAGLLFAISGARR
jgi:hypothetical protein